MTARPKGPAVTARPKGPAETASGQANRAEAAASHESSLAGATEYRHIRQDLKRIALYAGFLFAALGVLRLVLG